MFFSLTARQDNHMALLIGNRSVFSMHETSWFGNRFAPNEVFMRDKQLNFAIFFFFFCKSAKMESQVKFPDAAYLDECIVRVHTYTCVYSYIYISLLYKRMCIYM